MRTLQKTLILPQVTQVQLLLVNEAAAVVVEVDASHVFCVLRMVRQRLKQQKRQSCPHGTLPPRMLQRVNTIVTMMLRVLLHPLRKILHVLSLGTLRSPRWIPSWSH